MASAFNSSGSAFIRLPPRIAVFLKYIFRPGGLIDFLNFSEYVSPFSDGLKLIHLPVNLRGSSGLFSPLYLQAPMISPTARTSAHGLSSVPAPVPASLPS